TCVVIFVHAAAPHIYTLSLHDALPISPRPGPASRTTRSGRRCRHVPGPGPCAWRSHSCSSTPKGTRSDASAGGCWRADRGRAHRSEEHTSELQSRENLVCRLLLEKKNE